MDSAAITNDGLHNGDSTLRAGLSDSVPTIAVASVAVWRLAVVGSVSNIDTPALYLNRIEGVEAWRPSERRSIHRGKRCRKLRHIPTPIFGPYVFIKVPSEAIPLALDVRCGETPVLSRIITGGCGVSIIPEREIEALRQKIDAGAFASKAKPRHLFKRGDKARLSTQPFDGFDAKIEAVLGDTARVLVNLFGGETKATVPLTSLEAVRP